MATLAQELREKLRNTRAERTKFAAGFDKDNMPTEDDERKLDAMINGESDLEAEISRLDKFEGASTGQRPPGDEHPNPAKAARPQLITLGQRFVNSEEYKAALSRFAPEGRIPERGGFNMASIPFKGLSEMRSALITGGSDTSGGAFIVADRQADYVPLGRRPLTIRDIIRVLQTGSDLIEYVVQTGRTSRAATVAEATSVNDGAKPESDIAFEVRTAPVRTIANWTPATKQSVADAPQLRGIVDGELLDNLKETEEDEIVNGPGTGSHLTGITQTSGTQTQAWSSNILTTTRKAKTIVGTVGRTTPNAYVLSPGDWETIDLLQDNEARYFYGGPAQVGVPRLWGLPVVESEAMSDGGALVGNFLKAILWDREQGNIAITDSHADFFVRNLLAILAEERVAFALTQPSAMVEIDTAA